jgi:methyl-accepting chemotaxis protein
MWWKPRRQGDSWPGHSTSAATVAPARSAGHGFDDFEFESWGEDEMKLTLGKKLGLGFGVILALMVLSSVLTYLKASAIKETQDRTMTVRVPTISALKDLQRDLNQTMSKGRQVVLAGAESDRKEAAQKLFDGAWNDIEKDVASLDELSPKWSLQANRDRLAETKKALPILREAQEAAMKHAMGSDRDAVAKAGNEFADQATPANEAIKKPLGEVVDSNDKLLQQETEDLNGDNRSLNLTMAVTTFAALGIGIFVAIFLSRAIAGATQSVLVQAEAIAAGDLTRDDLKVRSKDELGDLTTAINKMSTSLKRMILAITENAMHVASASEELNSTSQQITANSEETSAQADVVSNSAQRSARTCRPLPPAPKRWAPASRRSPRTPPKRPEIATGPPSKSPKTTTATVSKLGDSSTEIGQVIKVITSIAQQTNLLALNATIEAARAGEAGKGFAVVANEVKELAKETAKATEDISRKIEAIQTDTKAAVDAIASISGVINQINDISSTIATAVEEQNATTNEMSRNVSEAAHGSGEITSNIAGVAEAAQSTTRGAGDTQKASQQLLETSAELRRLVEQFKINAAASTQERNMAARAGS